MSEKFPKILTEDGKSFDIPPEGSLGLLALGAVALKPWREIRKKIEAAKQAKKESEKTDNNTTTENLNNNA